MTIYSSTTLAELLDELDVRAPDLAAPIRERVEELEDERDDLQQQLDAIPETCANCEELEDDLDAHIECIADLEARIKELEDES